MSAGHSFQVGDVHCEINAFRIKVPEKGTSPDWHSYFLCGVQGVVERLPADKRKQGMLVVLSGNIPPASGLSSSSALVSAATLATSFVHKVASRPSYRTELNLIDIFASAFAEQKRIVDDFGRM